MRGCPSRCVNIKLNILDGLLTCFMSPLAAQIPKKKKKKKAAGALGLRVRFSTFSVEDQRRENPSSGKQQH